MTVAQCLHPEIDVGVFLLVRCACLSFSLQRQACLCLVQANSVRYARATVTRVASGLDLASCSPERTWQVKWQFWFRRQTHAKHLDIHLKLPFQAPEGNYTITASHHPRLWFRNFTTEVSGVGYYFLLILLLIYATASLTICLSSASVSVLMPNRSLSSSSFENKL